MRVPLMSFEANRSKAESILQAGDAEPLRASEVDAAVAFTQGDLLPVGVAFIQLGSESAQGLSPTIAFLTVLLIGGVYFVIMVLLVPGDQQKLSKNEQDAIQTETVTQ